MLFNSLHYVIFLPVVVALYFLLPQRFRWVFLLAASYYFYMCWKVEYILLIVASTLIDYVAARRMGSISKQSKRKKYLVLSLVSNLGLLFAFKYFNFFSDSTREVLNHFNIFYNVPYFKALLPVGISFYTFQTLSYTISVYRGVHPPQRHLGIFALYVSFFPQLVAGPIERSSNLLPQFFEKHDFDTDRVSDGLKLILWGLFKKVVIADRAAVIVNTVYGNPEGFNGPQLIIATVFFAFQIYCDFSGYSDIAIGSAQLLGYRLMLNFNRPYYSKSIAEFWQRWHISLSTWFRDYLYISLGGNRVGKARWYLNLMTTFVVSGLWHGANWTFVVWGGLNGLYLVMEILTARIKAGTLAMLGLTEKSWSYKIPAVAWTFALTCLAWIFFRADSVRDALYIIAHLGDGTAEFLRALVTVDLPAVNVSIRGLGLSRQDFLIVLVAIGVLESVHFIQRTGGIRTRLRRQPVAVRWAVYYALVGAIIIFGAFNQSQQFIYFQF